MKRAARNDEARVARVHAAPCGAGARDGDVLDDVIQRLAFERMLARLYRALAARLGRSGGEDGGPNHRDLARIDGELLRRCELLDEAIDVLAPGHRTTPAGAPRLVGTCEFGAVLADPRYGVAQCIEAILVTELLDNHAWAALVKRLEAKGLHGLALAFADTVKEGQAQLSLVRGWIRAARGLEVRPAGDRNAARLASGLISWQRCLR